MVYRHFSVKVDPWQLAAVVDSIGAHIASKLEGFGNDERTLTDELVDMWCLWAAAPPDLPTSGAFTLDLTKVSQTEESASGADLELVLRTPSGLKRALFQAKVIEPALQSVRGGPGSLVKLEEQLEKARRVAGRLAFGLFYVPANELDGAQYAYPTWEQMLRFGGSSKTPARFGATVIPVDDLLDSAGKYRQGTGLQYVGRGVLNPRGISLTQLLFELLACRRGTWEDAARTIREESPARIRIVAGVAVEEPERWITLEEEAGGLLNELFGEGL
jgi:hypothetical protein